MRPELDIRTSHILELAELDLDTLPHNYGDILAALRARKAQGKLETYDDNYLKKAAYNLHDYFNGKEYPTIEWLTPETQKLLEDADIDPDLKGFYGMNAHEIEEYLKGYKEHGELKEYTDWTITKAAYELAPYFTPIDPRIKDLTNRTITVLYMAGIDDLDELAGLTLDQLISKLTNDDNFELSYYDQALAAREVYYCLNGDEKMTTQINPTITLKERTAQLARWRKFNKRKRVHKRIWQIEDRFHLVKIKKESRYYFADNRIGRLSEDYPNLEDAREAYITGRINWKE